MRNDFLSNHGLLYHDLFHVQMLYDKTDGSVEFVCVCVCVCGRARACVRACVRAS
jgi:hypothetical protein